MLSSSAEFIHGVSLFSVKGDRDKKLRCKSDSHTIMLGSPSVCHGSVLISMNQRTVFI